MRMSATKIDKKKKKKKNRGRSGLESHTWISQIVICYIAPWCHLTLSNSESGVVGRVLRLQPWPPSWTLEQNDLAILNVRVTRCLPLSFGSIWLTIWEEMWFQRISRWRHLRHWTRTILTISNFNNTPNASHHVSAKSDLRSWADLF